MNYDSCQYFAESFDCVPSNQTSADFKPIYTNSTADFRTWTNFLKFGVDFFVRIHFRALAFQKILGGFSGVIPAYFCLQDHTCSRLTNSVVTFLAQDPSA